MTDPTTFKIIRLRPTDQPGVIVVGVGDGMDGEDDQIVSFPDAIDGHGAPSPAVGDTITNYCPKAPGTDDGVLQAALTAWSTATTPATWNVVGSVAPSWIRG